MNIEATKYELINRLTSTNDEKLLEQLVAVFNNADFKQKQVTLEQYNNELKVAESRINSGHFTSHSDLEQESEAW
jgi:hypothetical protein